MASVPNTFVPGTKILSGQVNANFAALVAAINAITGAGVREVTWSSGSIFSLLNADTFVGLTNATNAALSIAPPPAPAPPQIIWIVDEGGNAGTYNWSWNGVLSGQTNPLILQAPYGVVRVLYTGTKWVQV